MNRTGLALLAVGALAGCSLLSPPAPEIVVQEKPVQVICSATTQKPDALVLIDTPPTVVLGPDEIWGYWFSPDLYGALAENLQAMRRYQQQQRDIRGQLVECIEKHNEQIETD